jgi:ribosomal-protein-alanine N-acetyltransferase
LNLDHITIRSMSLNDINKVTDIEKISTPYPWNKEQFIDSYEKHICVIMANKGFIIGYAIYNIVVDAAEVLNITICSKHQNNGYGRYLLEHLVSALPKNIKRFFLEVRASNANAIHLYENVGFVAICERKNYYHDGSKSEDAVLMAAEL